MAHEGEPRRDREERRAGGRDGWKIWGGALGLTVIGFAIAWQFVEPAPPSHLVIATGPADGAYHAFGVRYAELLGEQGFDVELQTTNGSVENVSRLARGEVDVAFAQGGTLGDPPTAGIIGLASLYYEPLWLFVRKGFDVGDLRDLAGLRLVVGPEGSGTRAVATALLRATGLGDGDWTEVASDEEADAVFVVGGASSARVGALIAEDGAAWRLVDMRRAAAYEARFRALQTVVLSEGMFDLAKNIPGREVHLLSPTAQLIADEGLHHSLIPLLIETAERVHGRGGLFEAASEFPSRVGLDAPLAPEAAQYYKSGRSFLFRVLPFWLAAIVDRLKVLLLPLLTLLLPLIKVAPPLYRWRIRSKIYRWYAVLRDVEKRGRQPGVDDERLRDALIEVESEIRDVDIPASYMEELYNLRMHLERVREKMSSEREST